MDKISEDLNQMSGRIVSNAMKVHTLLGPGLLERVYEEALAYFLIEDGLAFEKQKEIPIRLNQVNLECGFRADLIVNEKIIVELKAIEKILPIHEAQMMTYLRLADKNLGLILNFNVMSMKDGIKRMIYTKKNLV
jgi:GxxExxY protein